MQPRRPQGRNRPAAWVATRTATDQSAITEAMAQRLRQRWKVYLNNLANHIHINTEVLVYQNVAEAANLRPRHAWKDIGDTSRQMIWLLHR